MLSLVVVPSILQVVPSGIRVDSSQPVLTHFLEPSCALWAVGEIIQELDDSSQLPFDEHDAGGSAHVLIVGAYGFEVAVESMNQLVDEGYPFSVRPRFGETPDEIAERPNEGFASSQELLPRMDGLVVCPPRKPPTTGTLESLIGSHLARDELTATRADCLAVARLVGGDEAFTSA